MNFQRMMSPDGNYTYEYVRIGGWDSGNLTMNDHSIFWPVNALSDTSLVESVCSKPCPRGQVKVCGVYRMGEGGRRKLPTINYK